MSIYRDKVAVITGAGSGIGRALAVGLAREGARLALSDIRAEGLAETASLCRTTGGATAKTYPLDVADRNAVFAHAEEVRRDLGAPDYLFNNAGVALIATVADATIEEMEWQIDINLWGVIYCTKAFLPMMLERRAGCVVNLSSILGLIAFPGLSAYNITKFGVRGFTEALWYELHGTGVRAVSVHPGGIRTNIDKAARRSRNAGADEARIESSFRAILSTPPEKCAREIIEGVRAGKRRILTGRYARLVSWLARLLPNSYFLAVGWRMTK